MQLTSALAIRYPVIMAPMFLVSNEKMVKAAMDNGIAGTFPSLNYRKEGELKQVLDHLNQHRAQLPPGQGTYGVNLIVQKTNPLYSKHLKDCVAAEVPFYITSLGSPKEVIAAAHSYGAKVLCDVTNIQHAEKAAQAGCDGFIAVCAGAGGHAGPYPMHILVPALQKAFPGKLLVAAGGIATGQQLASALVLGAHGASIGTRFIASEEASVSDEYKNAILDYGMEDIVLTERLSGTPCNVINTPTAKKIGYKQNWLEKQLNKNARTRKYFKMLVQLRGMKKLEAAVRPGNYQQLWSAGQSVEMVEDISSIHDIVNRLIQELEETLEKTSQLFVK
ncbi:nitronate monooxygenase family protein [Chitinophaga sp. CF418]|uniref:NAD(P)H-dependent flavin oxidoreductase n=1 Tax=Chitinophaga sp. CF418 TaxID=1855287 RepID=UPI00091BBC1E|nr:nitronate monooxygenase [Chitinophaga sp. CF418]SHM96344.1 nitronate monooxygenase [Chitinophaga sp. CF418]